MATFHDLPEEFTTPSRHISDDELDALVGMGGYTHPLFADPAYAQASTFGGRLLPGPVVVMLMAGLVEQSGRFDESVIALVGMDAVRFPAPVRPGDEVEVAVRVLAREVRSRADRGLLRMAWTCRGVGAATSHDDRVQLEARMLFRLDPPDG